MRTTARAFHTNSRLRFRGVVIITLSATLLTLSGCGGSNEIEGRTSPNASGNKSICEAAAAERPKSGAAMVSLIVDRTASARTDVTMPPGLNETLAEVQKKALGERSGSAIQTISVSGSGEFPPIGPTLNLDPRPEDTSPNANNIRAKILNDCIPGLLESDGANPKSDNTDLIGALLAARQQDPTQILVISSGLNSTALANLQTPPADPAEMVAAVKAEAPDFESWSIPVTWYNLGEPNPPLSAQDRERVIMFWKALLGDQLIVDTRE